MGMAQRGRFHPRRRALRRHPLLDGGCQQRRRTGGYMPTHVPPMIDMDQFQTGAAGIQVKYYQADLTTGALTEFSCDSGECSAACVPRRGEREHYQLQVHALLGFFSSCPRSPSRPSPPACPWKSAGCDESGNWACHENGKPCIVGQVF